MDLNDTPELAEFRAKVRAWLDEHKGEAPPNPGASQVEDDEAIARRRAWQARLTEGGLNGVTWPAEYGGQGLGPLHQVVDRPGDRRAPASPGSSTSSASACSARPSSPTAAEEQKERYLLPLLRGDEVWCQLFSEPAAGSDLAAIQTRAQARRRRLGAQRPEGVDDQRAVRRVRPAAGAHGPRRCPSTRA